MEFELNKQTIEARLKTDLRASFTVAEDMQHPSQGFPDSEQCPDPSTSD